MPILGRKRTVSYPQFRRYVRVAEKWGDDWIFVRRAEPIDGVWAAAPEVGRADFRYHIGQHRSEQQTSKETLSPLNLRNWFCEISIQEPGYQAVPLWYGIIADEEDSIYGEGNNPVLGWQQFQAYGLGHVLDRTPVSHAWCLPTNSQTEDEIIKIDRVPTFNRRNRNGRTLIGNRSLEKVDMGEGSYVFKAGNDVDAWSNLDICEYLLYWFNDSGLPFQLAGQLDALALIVEDHNLQGLTVWQALNRLISRAQGLGFIPWVDSEGTIHLWVFSVSEREIRYGQAILPANDNPVYFELPGGPSASLLDEMSFRITELDKFDRLEVVGERFQSCCTWSIRDKTLERDWSLPLEVFYKNPMAGAVNEDDAAANDLARSADRFSHVYSRFRVPLDWDGNCGDGQGENFTAALPKANRDGSFSEGEVGPFWQQDKTFERSIPDLSQQSASPDETADFRPLFGAVKLPESIIGVVVGGQVQAAIGFRRWCLLERLADVNQILSSCHVTPTDHYMGMKVDCSPRHEFADGHDDDMKATQYSAQLDYEEMVFTAMVVGDERPQIVVDVVDTDSPRTMRIEVPGVETWYVHPAAARDISEFGALEPFEDYGFVRDDSARLESIAAFTLAWYGVRRQAIRIPIKRLGVFVRPGSMLTDVVGYGFREPINTPVSAIHWDFTLGRTTIETGWGVLDQAPIPSEMLEVQRWREQEFGLKNINQMTGDVWDDAKSRMGGPALGFALGADPQRFDPPSVPLHIGPGSAMPGIPTTFDRTRGKRILDYLRNLQGGISHRFLRRP